MIPGRDKSITGMYNSFAFLILAPDPASVVDWLVESGGGITTGSWASSCCSTTSGWLGSLLVDISFELCCDIESVRFDGLERAAAVVIRLLGFGLLNCLDPLKWDRQCDLSSSSVVNVLSQIWHVRAADRLVPATPTVAVPVTRPDDNWLDVFL